jgi:hypothetical protein
MNEPLSDVPTRRFLRMTTLPEEMEKDLLRLPYKILIQILRLKTVISGTDTNYTAIQFIAKEFSEDQIAKLLVKFKDEFDKVGDSRLYTPVSRPLPLTGSLPPLSNLPPILDSVSTVSVNPVSVKPLSFVKPISSGNSHPQPIINSKTATAKVAGGSISFSRANKGWLVIKANKEGVIWTSEQFRLASEKEVTDFIIS